MDVLSINVAAQTQVTAIAPHHSLADAGDGFAAEAYALLQCQSHHRILCSGKCLQTAHLSPESAEYQRLDEWCAAQRLFAGREPSSSPFRVADKPISVCCLESFSQESMCSLAVWSGAWGDGQEQY